MNVGHGGASLSEAGFVHDHIHKNNGWNVIIFWQIYASDLFDNWIVSLQIIMNSESEWKIMICSISYK